MRDDGLNEFGPGGEYMLSETIVEFVDSVRGNAVPVQMQVCLAPEDCFAFLAFVSTFARWNTITSHDIN